MKYCTDDGKHVFNTQEEYHDYITKEANKKLAAKKLAKDKKKRADEITDLSNLLREKLNSYKKDYREDFPGVITIIRQDANELPKDFNGLYNELLHDFSKIFGKGSCI